MPRKPLLSITTLAQTSPCPFQPEFGMHDEAEVVRRVAGNHQSTYVSTHHLYQVPHHYL